MVAEILQTAINGLSAGAAYALLGVGFTLMFGVMRRLNLSYGATLMFGGYLGALLAAKAGNALPGGLLALLAAVVTVAGATLAGLYVERLCFAPLRGRSAVAAMVSSFAVWMQIEELSSLMLPLHTNPYPAPFDIASVDVAGLTLQPEHLLTLVVAALVGLLLHRLLAASQFGLALRTLSDSEAAAQAVGIDVRRVTLLAFVLASALGGIGAWLVLIGQPAGDADVRHVVDRQGAGRHDAGRTGLNPGRHRRRIAFGAGRGVRPGAVRSAGSRSFITYGLLFLVPGGPPRRPLWPRHERSRHRSARAPVTSPS